MLVDMIMWYYNCTREEAEELYDTLSDDMLYEIDMSYYAWTHNIDW